MPIGSCMNEEKIFNIYISMTISQIFFFLLFFFFKLFFLFFNSSWNSKKTKTEVTSNIVVTVNVNIWSRIVVFSSVYSNGPKPTSIILHWIMIKLNNPHSGDLLSSAYTERSK